MTTLTVAARFAGPPRSGNGGYVSGRLAAHADHPGAVTVTLRRPPPLDAPMAVRHDADGLRLLHDDALVAEARPGEFAHDPAGPVDLAVAAAAEAVYPGLTRHPFPGCFVCGPARMPGDGLRLFPGPTASGTVACVWLPDASLADPGDGDVAAAEFGWAALDCPGAWTSDLHARPLVLGRMTALCERRPRVGEPHVVVGQLLDQAGRKTMTATALYDSDGDLLGRAEQVWIAIDPQQFS